MCRLLSFVWAYCYHDWQSVILLIWIVHSTMFKSTKRFKIAMLFFYLPVITIIFFWYYVTNIWGLLRWADQDQQRITTLYKYGFYKMHIPPLEIGFMFCNVVCFIKLAQILKPESEDASQKSFLSKLGNPNSSIMVQFLFLFLIYVEYPLMLFLVLAGLDKMDVYHIMMLLFFICYTLTPSLIKDRSIILLVYANLFVLEKYIFTLVYKPGTDTHNWIEILGLSTPYDPSENQQYFRYKPRADQWILVLLTLSLYRRQEVLGTDDKEKFMLYTRQAENQIKLRLPTFY